MYLHLTHVQFAAAASDEQMTIHLEDNVDLHQQHGMACQLAMYQMTAPGSDPHPLPYPTTQSPIPGTYAAFPPGRSVPPAAPAPCWTPDICTCCSGRCVLFCVSPGDSQSHGGPSIRRHLFASLRRRSAMLRSVPVDLQWVNRIHSGRQCQDSVDRVEGKKRRGKIHEKNTVGKTAPVSFGLTLKKGKCTIQVASEIYMITMMFA